MRGPALVVLGLLLAAKRSLVAADEDYEFWQACQGGNLSAMQALLKTAADLDLECVRHVSSMSNDPPARFLLASGANVDAPGRWPGPEDGPLAVASSRGDLRMMDALLEAGAAVGAATGPGGRTPLMSAAATGQTEAVRVLLGVGANVDARRQDGTTAACWAARGGHADTLQVLLDHGADVSSHDDVDGSTPLHFAAQAEDGEATRVALAAGADLLSRTSVLAPRADPNGESEDDEYVPKREELRGGMTPLMSAASAASVSSIQVLVTQARRTLDSSNFAEYVNAVDVSGMTALAWACSVPNSVRTVQALEALAEAGARDDSITVDGRAVLHVAAFGRNARAIAWLVDVKGHAVDARSPGKRHTPLIIAAFQGSRACVKALLHRGADVNAAAPDGATPLISAASAGQKAVVKLLLKKGADPLRRLASGEFPSQVTPKTPHGKRLKWALSKAERKAWRRLERDAQRRIEQAGGSAPPEQEEGVQDSLVEDLEEGNDDAETSDEDEEDTVTGSDEL